MRQKTRLLTLLVLLAAVVTGAWAQTGMTNGLFSVSATKRVYFSKGNLQYDGTNWKFAENQWEVLGANGTGATGTATNYPMDFFTWGNIDSPTYNGTTYYTENADLSGITDWGSRMGSGWYTLSKDEWLYLFGMESSNTDKSGHARYRKYFRAKVNGVSGIVVLPDDLSGISDIPAESSRGTASNFAKTYTTDAWSAMESAGCVFLPTAGFRKTDASVSHVGWSGFYWESTAYDAGKAYTMGFDNTFVDPAGNFDRTFGFAVRLVIDQYYLTLADGVKDADKWTVKVGEGQAQALPIGGLKGDGSETVTLKYNGRLKVKGVKATSDAAPAKEPATVTTAPTGAAIVGRLNTKNTALVSGGAADGGTLRYAVTTTNTKPTSTDGFSTDVPTAQTIKASGTVYVWYYVKGDDTHSDSEIAAIEVPVADIVWDVTNVTDISVEGDSYMKEGVTLSAHALDIYAGWNDSEDPTTDGISFQVFETGGYTFTAPDSKKFTKIEMTLNGSEGWDIADLGTDWTFDGDFLNEIFTVTWKGSATTTDALLQDTDDFVGANVISIAFYLSE